MILSFVLLKQKLPLKPFSSTQELHQNLHLEIIREEDEFYSKRSRLNSCTHTAQFQTRFACAHRQTDLHAHTTSATDESGLGGCVNAKSRRCCRA